MVALLFMILSPFTLHVPPAVLDRDWAVKAAKPEKQNYVVTADTEVSLDGKRCRFADVPPGAEIDALDLAADGKTIKKLAFRSKRP